MLKIDPTQFAALEAAAFRRQLVTTLAANEQEAAYLRGPAGAAKLDQIIAAARERGFTAHYDIARYVIAAWLMGEDFATRMPAVAELLVSPQFSATEKADRLEGFTKALFGTLQA